MSAKKQATANLNTNNNRILSNTSKNEQCMYFGKNDLCPMPRIKLAKPPKF